MTESLSQDTGFIDPVRKVMESRAGSIDAVCRYLHKWDLDAAKDILTMCGCHLPQSDAIRDEVEDDCKEDPEGLALRLAVSAALEVAESSALSLDLRRELQRRQLVKLLTADPLNGGDLRKPHGSLFPKCGAENLSDAELSRLNSWALGLRVLATLPLPWQQRCAVLHGHPHLILEVLLMRKQLESASLILKEFPSLRDNNLILTYSAKAIAVSSNSPP
ncbi:hypothetical protein QJS10_CPB14g01007 [Acorus calamus]|uniref:Uncharacterized protein n=1 Tax=Acorus calamus TaxID=4465 RepID=A0AAV9DE24_ACOCL|nr:hypothetical protein QJS10_CPB14g01007 [Acorus calamus]